MRFFSGLYHAKGEAVWFEGRPCTGAKVSSFVNLGHGWAKSDKFVYHWGAICRSIDAKSIELLNALYVRDAGGIHHYLKARLSPTPAGFRVLDPGFHSGTAGWDSDLRLGGYACDTTRVWWHHRPVRGADPATFQSLRSGYGIDGNSVYLEERRIAQADPATFVAYSARMALDRNHVFFAGAIVPHVSPDQVQKMLVDDVSYDGTRDLISHGTKPLQGSADYIKLLDEHIDQLKVMRNLVSNKAHHRDRSRRYAAHNFIPVVNPKP